MRLMPSLIHRTDWLEIQETSKRTPYTCQSRHDGKNSSSRNSTVALHCHKAGHDRNKIVGKLLHVCSKNKTLNRLEEVETLSTLRSAGPSLLNDKSSKYVSPILKLVHLFISISDLCLCSGPLLFKIADIF